MKPKVVINGTTAVEAFHAAPIRTTRNSKQASDKKTGCHALSKDNRFYS
jgi:hypothetical protein